MTKPADTREEDDHDGDTTTLPAIPWPQLDPTALAGRAGQIVQAVAPHTEADPAAILLQLLATFGAIIGPEPHIYVGNDTHHAVIHPLIVGKTSSGAKGTGLAVVEAIRKEAIPEFDGNVISGLSSAEGLIEAIRDGHGDDDPGVTDKRLLIRETEYRSVLTRARREGNTLGTVLRQVWDGETLRVLNRKHNQLSATGGHVVIIGHITPKEFRETLRPGELAGGNINRLLIGLSQRRPGTTSRLGNLPDDVLNDAATVLKVAVESATTRARVGFTEEFWEHWEAEVHPSLSRERPESDATDATARAIPQVLRLALMFALFDGAEKIDIGHLVAAAALWQYCEDSARWMFSTFQKEQHSSDVEKLAAFIRAGGPNGRSRTEISRDHFRNNKSKAHIDARLGTLVHDGVILESDKRFVHRYESTKNTKTAGQGLESRLVPERKTTNPPKDDSSQFVPATNTESTPDLGISSDSSIRRPSSENDEPVMCGNCQEELATTGGKHCGFCEEQMIAENAPFRPSLRDSQQSKV